MTFYFGPRPVLNPVVVRGTDSAVTNGVNEAQAEIARLHLQLETLCRLLIAKGVLTEQELNEWLAYVDSLDGTSDGRLRRSRKPIECPSCKRMNAPTAGKCQYCETVFTPQYLERYSTE